MKANSTAGQKGNAVVREMHGMSGAPPTNAVVHSSHNQHAGHSARMFRNRFWLSLVLTLPVVFWSAEVQQWLGYHAPVFPGSRFVPAILGTIIFVYGGRIFIQGARGELSARQPGMMTLISLAIVVSFAASLAATLGLFQVDIWWELSTLISVMLLGHWLEIRAVTQARGALSALAALLPDSAERITESGIEKVPLAALRVDDVVFVRPGSRVPADGVVVEGTAEVDESLITGESRAIPKATGSAVVGGTVAAGGSLRVRVRAIGEETKLSGIMRLVAAAQASGSRAQALADRAAALLFYIAVGTGTLTFAYWWLAGERQHALIRSATVLVIACPHALGLSILGETAAVCLALDARCEVRQVGASIQSGCTFNRGRIGNRSWIAYRFAFPIPRFRRPDGDQLGFAGFGRSVRLLARAILDFLGAHRHPRAIHAQVHSGSGRSYFPRFFDLLLFIDGDLGSQGLGRSFHLLRTDFHSRQLVQQPTALFETHQCGCARRHAQNAGRQRKRFQPQCPVRRAEPALALLTVIVGPLKVQGSEYAFEGLLMTAMVLCPSSTGAGQFRSDMIAGVGV